MKPWSEVSLVNCARKRRYLTRKEAKEDLRKIRNRWRGEDTPETLRPYPCPICSGFHLTHTKQTHRE